jgi:hypothetical protein
MLATVAMAVTIAVMGVVAIAIAIIRSVASVATVAIAEIIVLDESTYNPPRNPCQFKPVATTSNLITVKVFLANNSWWLMSS